MTTEPAGREPTEDCTRTPRCRCRRCLAIIARLARHKTPRVPVPRSVLEELYPRLGKPGTRRVRLLEFGHCRAARYLDVRHRDGRTQRHGLN